MSGELTDDDKTVKEDVLSVDLGSLGSFGSFIYSILTHIRCVPAGARHTRIIMYIEHGAGETPQTPQTPRSPAEVLGMLRFAGVDGCLSV